MSDGTLRHFEDIRVGETHDCGSVAVDRSEMVRFAERYDPLAIHVDGEAPDESPFDALIASGWLTCGLTARLVALGFLEDTALIAGRGIDELRWHHPVYADDTLSVSVTVVDTETTTDASTGDVRTEITTTNQDGDLVLSMYGNAVVAKTTDEPDDGRQ
ncbi:MaoC/PaaZ C-terminal domain-containing protein [Halobacteriales archaeon Cl-PHB]